MNMKSTCFVLLFCWNVPLFAQMWDPDLQDTIFGNEWIDYVRTDAYFKIPVSTDGIYRIPKDVLPAQAQLVSGSRFQLFHLGKEIPLYVSTDGVLSADDYLEFFGRKNRAELDRHLFSKPDDELLNPFYSMFTDTAFYFLTWQVDAAAAKRFVTVPNELNNLPPKAGYYFHQELLEFHTTSIRKGVNIGGVGLEQSHYDFEGFGSEYLKKHTLKLPLRAVFTGGGDAVIDLAFATRQNIFHDVAISLDGIMVSRDTFDDFRLMKKTFFKSAAGLGSEIEITIEGHAANNDRSSMIYAWITYPRQFDFNQKNSFSFSVEASASVTYLEIEQFDAGTTPPVLYDLTNQLRIIGSLNGSTVRIALPPAPLKRDLVLVDPITGIRLVEVIEPVVFENYSIADAQFIILSHPFFTTDSPNPVEAYAEYRRSAAGGGFRTIVVDIRQLYDQFAFGVQRTPLAIRNFAHFVKKKWRDPRYFFIIGKAREYADIREATALSEASERTFFIPTFGISGSDNLLLSGNTTAAPILPVGRLAATGSEDIRHYLQKIKTYESIQQELQTVAGDHAWTKQVVHLSGGIDPTEQLAIKVYLETMEQSLRQSRMGAEISTFYKTGTGAVQQSQTAGLKEKLEDGLAILTFFGHANASIFDFNFDDPGSYANFGKYPLLISNGCFSGNCNTEVSGIGERFVMAEDKGAIAYFASSGYGFITALSQLGNHFYEEMGGRSYGKGIGDILKTVYEKLQFDASVGLRELVQQTILQGDPAVKIYHHPGPDYSVDRNTLVFEPRFLNAQLDSFSLRFDLLNTGEYLPDTTFVLQILHELPSGQKTEVIRDTVGAPAFRAPLDYRIALPGEAAIGNNRLHIQVDANDAIRELPVGAEGNNSLIDAFGNPGLGFRIVSNDVLPLEPEHFAIVTTPQVTLKASTIDVFAAAQNYLFEIDTSQLFEGTFVRRYVLRSRGGVLKWTLPFALENNTTYYWRVTPDSLDADGYRWQNRSFTYLEKASSGWNQSHFYQLSENRFDDLELSAQTKQLKFVDVPVDVKIRNYIYQNPNQIPRYLLNNETKASYLQNIVNTMPAGLYIAVLDTITANPMINTGNGIYGNEITRPDQDWAAFPFKTDSANERAEIIHFLQNIVPSGYYVLLFTVQRSADDSYLPEQWSADSLSLGTSIFRVLEAQGVQKIRRLATTGAVPYTLFYKKDDSNWPVQETIGDLNGIIEQNTVIPSKWTNGWMESAMIGPASSWDSLKWQVSGIDTSADQYSLDLIGLSSDGGDTVLLEGLHSNLNLNEVDPIEFPFLKMRLNAADTALRSPVQLNYWRIFHEPLPEAALNPASFFEFYRDTLRQGDTLRAVIAVENVSEPGMDSLLVHFIIEDRQNNSFRTAKRFEPLPGRDSLVAAFSFDTRLLRSGAHALHIEMNPNGEQRERLFLNNSGALDFFVETDRANPLLDVTFDGEHIFWGDIISPRPNILITLRDENPFLALGDTSLFELYLQSPGDADFRRLSLAEPTIIFSPAKNHTLSEENKATIVYRPHFTLDGAYVLKVRTRDASGNLSGDFDFEIGFRVVTRSMISGFAVFPNPFSSTASFVYTLTGEEHPAQFGLRIRSADGRLVREITQDEVGTLRIGSAQTACVWDGTDQAGKPLPNGIYFYEIDIRKANGQPFDPLDPTSYPLFQSNFGKIVILR